MRVMKLFWGLFGLTLVLVLDQLKLLQGESPGFVVERAKPAVQTIVAAVRSVIGADLERRAMGYFRVWRCEQIMQSLGRTIDKAIGDYTNWLGSLLRQPAWSVQQCRSHVSC